MSCCTKRAVAVPCARSSPRRSYPRRCTSCRSSSRSDHQPCSKSIVSFTVEEVVQATGGQLAHLPSAHHGTSGKICTDTREPMRGAWFVALAGENFDGVAFAEQARDRGCLGVVAPAKPPSDWQGAAWIVCPSTGRDALGALGRAARRRLPPQCPVVAVTGSAGKTTTRELAALMLTGGLGDVHATKGNLNNDVGVPKTLLDLPDAGTRAVVLEMGMSAPGEIETLAAVGEPNVRIVTNVALAHAATCGGTLAGVAACKAELINTARDGDHVVLNADDSHVAAMAQLARQNGATVWYFCRDGCDRHNTNAATTQRRTVTWTEPHVADATGLSQIFQLQLEGERVDVRLAAPPGSHLAANAAAAAAACAAVGVPLSCAADALAAFSAPQQRLAPRTLPSGSLLLDDCYNANPASMQAAISTARAVANASSPPRRVVMLLGDMLELGPGEDPAHEDVLRAAFDAAQPGDVVGVCGERFARALASRQKGEKAANGVVVLLEMQGPASLGHAATPFVDDGNAVVLTKGSRGSRMENAIGPLP